MTTDVAKRKGGARSARSVELAKIHIGAEQLGLRRPGDDSTYRDMLWSIGRVRSAADLDAAGREAVLAHLRANGFRDQSPPKGSTHPRYQKGTRAALIRWLWTQLRNEGLVRDGSDRALRRYIATHGIVDHGADARPDEIAPQHLEREDQSRVIEQLKAWLARKGEVRG